MNVLMKRVSKHVMLKCIQILRNIIEYHGVFISNNTLCTSEGGS